jgi:hypothetical protein
MAPKPNFAEKGAMNMEMNEVHFKHFSLKENSPTATQIHKTSVLGAVV